MKNLRKDGGYYWVYAEVFSNFRRGELVGYTSSRRAISAKETLEVEEKYAKMLAKEVSHQVA